MPSPEIPAQPEKKSTEVLYKEASEALFKDAGIGENLGEGALGALLEW